MTIRYTDGRTYEAVLLSRSDDTLRIAVKNTEDVQLFNCINGTWVSEDCEPVHIDFEWQRRTREEAVAEADCICPAELAGRLIYLLFSGREDAEIEAQALLEKAPPARSVNHPVI